MARDEYTKEVIYQYVYVRILRRESNIFIHLFCVVIFC